MDTAVQPPLFADLHYLCTRSDAILTAHQLGMIKRLLTRCHDLGSASADSLSRFQTRTVQPCFEPRWSPARPMTEIPEALSVCSVAAHSMGYRRTKSQMWYHKPLTIHQWHHKPLPNHQTSEFAFRMPRRSFNIVLHFSRNLCSMLLSSDVAQAAMLFYCVMSLASGMPMHQQTTVSDALHSLGFAVRTKTCWLGLLAT